MAYMGGPEKKGHKMKSKGYKAPSGVRAGALAARSTLDMNKDFGPYLRDQSSGSSIVNNNMGTVRKTNEETFTPIKKNGGIFKEAAMANKKRRTTPRGY